MIASRVIPPTEEEGADVEGAEEVGGAAVYVWSHHGLSYALLCQMVETSMAPITEK